MITENEMIPMVLEHFPEFIPLLEVEKEWWGEDINDFSPWLQLVEFGRYIKSKIKEKPQDETYLQRAFNLIERFALEGNEYVQGAACTEFLENLSNVTPEEIDGPDFVKYLGPESKDYLKAWDETCGLRMNGLWED